MTVISRTPENTNYLQPTKFLVTFDRIPNTTYFCQSINIPGLSIGQAPLPHSSITSYAPGNQITYNVLTMEFTIDEKAQSWKDIHSWFLSIASPKGSGERNRLTNIQNATKTSTFKQYSDATLTLLSGLNNPIMRVRFVNAFPITISDINFDTKQSADTILTASASFLFEYMEFDA